MGKRPTSGSKKPRSKLQRVDARRSLALAEFDRVTAWTDEILARVARGEPVEPRLVRNAVIARALLGTAARRFELCGFRCGDFREALGKYTCYFEAGKGNVEAEITISAETWGIVQSWLAFKNVHGESTKPEAPLFCGRPGEHLSVAQLHNVWVDVRKATRIPLRDIHCAVHMTRHTAGFLYLRATNSLSATAQFMRHKSQEITERFYKHVLDADVVAGLTKARL